VKSVDATKKQVLTAILTSDHFHEHFKTLGS